MDTKKQLNIIVTGLDVIDKAYDSTNNITLTLEEDFPKFEKRENRKGPLYILITVIVMLVLGVIAAVLEDNMVLMIVLFGGPAFFVWNITGRPKMAKAKIDARKSEIEQNKNKVNYISDTREAIQKLIDKKDRLYDFYLAPENRGVTLIFVVPEEDEKYEEIGKFYSIYVHNTKLIKEEKYSTLIIEEDNAYSLGYKITLVMPYNIYKESASWLR